MSLQRLIRLGKESGWLVAGQVLGTVGGLALIRETTFYLSLAQYGHLTLAITVGVLVCQVSMSGVMPGIVRYYTLAVERGDLSNFTVASYRLMGFGVLATFALGGMALLVALFAGKSDWIANLLLAIVFMQLSSFNSTLSAIQNAARQRNVVVLHGIVDPWIKIGLLTLATLIVDKSVAAVIAAYTLAALLLLGSQWFFFKRLVLSTPDREKTKPTSWIHEMVRYSKPFMAFNFFTWLQASSDRWVLEQLAGTQAVGQYAVLSQLGNTPVAMIVGLITNLVGPILQQRSGDATDPARNYNVWRISWLITLFGLGVTVFAVLLAYVFHEWLFSLLVAEAYRDKSYLLPWIVLGGGMFAASQVLTAKIQSDLNTRALTIPKVTTSILALTLNSIGAWFWGIEGVVGASIIFSASILFWLAALNRYPHKPRMGTSSS